MPTVLRTGPYRLFFYSNEGAEAPHVHVDKDDQSAKFWLDPVRLAANVGFSAKEIRVLTDLVRSNENACLEAWNEYFKTSRQSRSTPKPRGSR